MDKDIKVSVIVLAYNHEKYLPQALDSIISQKTEHRFEILINDDASTDGTALIAKDYADRYPDIIRFFKQENNLGGTRSGYEMLIRCRGEYIASCEGDDYWCDDYKLQKQIEFLDTHPDYSGCAHDMIIVDENGVPTKNQHLRWISRKRDYSAKDFKGIFLPGHPNSIMRRNLFLNPDYDGSIFYKAHRNIGDRTNALIWSVHGKIYRMPDHMGCYRCVRKKDGANLTSQLYVNSTDKLRDDFRYTMTLEQYAADTLKCPDISFEYHKSELFVSAVFDAARKRCDADLPREILNSCQHKALCVLNAPVLIMKKAFEKLLGKNR